MKKIKRFLRKNLIELSLWFVGGLVFMWIYHLIHEVATQHRGYEAIGGEIFWFALPFIIYVIYVTAKDTFDICKMALKERNKR